MSKKYLRRLFLPVIIALCALAQACSVGSDAQPSDQVGRVQAERGDDPSAYLQDNHQAEGEGKAYGDYSQSEPRLTATPVMPGEGAEPENVNLPHELAIQEDADGAGIDLEVPQAEFMQSGDVIALTLLGIDTDPEREKAKRGYRSDSIAVIAINSKAKTCTVINVPRDTRTTVQRLDKNGKVISSKKDKVNSAYAYGGGAEKKSHQNALQAISNLLGVKLEYYASIDMDSIVPLANAVGGVPVVLEADFPGIGKKGDEVLLKDDQAYTFVRKRKGVTGGSDIGRIERQQLFIKSLAKKVQAMNPIEAIPKVLATLGGRVRTNLSLPQMLSLGSILKETDIQSIQFTTLPGHGQTINGTSYWIHDPKETQKIVQEAFGN